MTNLKKRKVFAYVILIIFVGIFLLNNNQSIFAADPNPLGELEKTGTEAYGTAPQEDISIVIGQIVKIVLGLMGMILLILFIIGGIMWMISGGNPEQIKKAKNLLLNAAIGLIIVIAAYTLAHFVIEKFSAISGT